MSAGQTAGPREPGDRLATLTPPHALAPLGHCAPSSPGSGAGGTARGVGGRSGPQGRGRTPRLVVPLGGVVPLGAYRPPPPEAHGQSPEATWRWLKGLFLVCDHGSSIPTQVQLGHKLEVTVNLVSGAKTGPGALRGFHPSFVGSLFERLVVNLKCGKLKERCAPSLQVKQTGDRGRLTLGLASAAPCGRGAHWASGTKDA